MARISFGIGFLAFLLFLGGLVFVAHTSSLCDRLSCVAPGRAQSLMLQETYINTPKLYRALYKQNSDYLRIEAKLVPRNESVATLNQEITTMKAMYEKAPAPYPGDISDAVVCDPEYIPSYEEIKTGKEPLYVFTGYLNNRMTFGSCSKSQAVYKGSMVYMYCTGSQKLIRLEFIHPLTEKDTTSPSLKDQFGTLTCGN